MVKLGRAIVALVALGSALLLVGGSADAQQDDPSQGETDQPQIIGGSAIPITDAPYQVALLDDPIPGFDNWFFQFCGGSILSSRVIMTAAHCVDEGGAAVAPSRLRVLAGRADLAPSGGSVAVDAVSMHPRWNPFRFVDDIAYLRLSAPLSFGPGVQPIATATPADVGLYPHGTDAFVSGWGSVDEDGDEDSDYPDLLMGVTVPIVGDAQCAAAFDAHPQFTAADIDHASHLCAGDADHDSCFGDSGGPLVVDDGGSPLLVGVVSWGPDSCADDIAPGVYAEVATYADMTEAHVGPAPFSDVRFGHPFLTPVYHLAQDEVLGGFADGSFRPAAVVTRQAMSAFMYRLAGEGGDEALAEAPAETSFSDVPADHPFATEILWMASYGISTGFPDGTFRPGAPVTRMAMSAFMYRLADGIVGPGGGPSFSDVPPSHPFFDEISWMSDAGVSTGYSNGTFRPGAAVTRQAMAAFLYRLLPLLA